MTAVCVWLTSRATFLPNIPGHAKRVLTHVLTHCFTGATPSPCLPPPPSLPVPKDAASQCSKLGAGGSERWWERWKKKLIGIFFLQLCFTLCFEVPEAATLLMPSGSQGLVEAATSASLPTYKLRSSPLPAHLYPGLYSTPTGPSSSGNSVPPQFIHSPETFFSAPPSLIPCPSTPKVRKPQEHVSD